MKNYFDLLKDNQKDIYKELIQDRYRVEYITDVFIEIDNIRTTYDILYNFKDIESKQDIRHKATRIKSLLLSQILKTVTNWQGLTTYQAKKQLLETNLYILLNKELIEYYTNQLKNLQDNNILNPIHEKVIEILKENMVYCYLLDKTVNINDYKF